MLIFFSHHLFSQVEADTVQHEEIKKEKKEKKKRDAFKIFAGATINNLLVSEDLYESTSMPGFMLGASYQRGRFFYWEIGARYNNYVFDLVPTGANGDTTLKNDFGVRVIDVPITGGINFTSFVSRIIGVRVFVSAVPSFFISMGENSALLKEENINRFNFHGQGGVGIDVAFIFIEGGFNFGFGDFMQTMDSNPTQVFVNLGFRF
jgi:hypothetical protein